MSELTKERRLCMLRILRDLSDRRCNSRVLTASLRQLGLTATQSEVEADMQWLRDGELIAMESLGDYQIAELLQRGEDVANGLIRVAGVARPGARG